MLPTTPRRLRSPSSSQPDKMMFTTKAPTARLTGTRAVSAAVQRRCLQVRSQPGSSRVGPMLRQQAGTCRTRSAFAIEQHSSYACIRTLAFINTRSASPVPASPGAVLPLCAEVASLTPVLAAAALLPLLLALPCRCAPCLCAP